MRWLKHLPARAAEGYLQGRRGAGTFVAAAKPQSHVLAIRNIAEEIRERGHEHAAEVIFLRRERARALEALGGEQQRQATEQRRGLERELQQAVQQLAEAPNQPPEARLRWAS